MEENKMDIRTLEAPELTERLLAMGEKKFRAQQVYDWLWKRGARDFSEMTNLSKSLREQLEATYIIQPIEIDTIQRSTDGTIKTRFKLHDDHLIESVLIPVPRDNRYTVCVSSQVGCSLNCTFCATGKMKRMRNLTAGEIYDQVVIVNQQALEHFSHPLTNIVYMGMGEPLLNYRETLRSIDRITSERGLGMSPKRITVSTSGIAKMIHKLAEDDVRFHLALSLHAANDAKRDQIMPINEQNNLEALMEALVHFHETNSRRRISYEYIAFQNFNDSLEDARELLRLCRRFPVRVNIIEYNPIDGAPFLKSAEHRIDEFARYLTERGVMVTVRRSRGRDIDAACGQLANKE